MLLYDKKFNRKGPEDFDTKQDWYRFELDDYTEVNEIIEPKYIFDSSNIWLNWIESEINFPTER